MAITSVAGATLTKLHSSGAGSTPQLSFVSQSYCGWIKIPSIGPVRTLFDHDGLLIIRLNTAGQIELETNGIVNTGTTVHPVNKWIFWCFDRTTGGINNVSTCWINCVDNAPVLTTPTTEISVTLPLTGTPTQFTLHIPAGCAICSFQYGNNSTNLIGTRFAWASSINTTSRAWNCPLRFPGDLYDHREISASSGDTTFAGMHNWTTQVGTIILDAGSDPEHLLDKNCSAILGIVPAVFTLQPSPTVIPAGATVFATQATALSIATNVLPATARLSRISLDGFTNGAFPPSPFTLPTFGSRWTFTGGPGTFDYFASHGYAGSFFGYYVWNTMWSGPNPNVNNPSNGLPFVLNDLYTATFEILGRWNNTSGSPSNAAPIFSSELGLSVIYFGQDTPGVCGIGPPPVVEVGTIVVVKSVTPNNGEEFTFNAGGLTPNSFILGNGETAQYDNVLVGSGYSIEEIVPAGWQVSYNVSNGSPNTNISVANGETVVITVTNVKLPNTTSGIYKIVPEKRQDTLWLENFVGTRDVKIP